MSFLFGQQSRGGSEEYLSPELRAYIVSKPASGFFTKKRKAGLPTSGNQAFFKMYHSFPPCSREGIFTAILTSSYNGIFHL
jgi:hypothetical protein